MNSDIMHLSDGYNEEYAQGEHMAMTMMVLMVINVYDDDAGVYGDACNDDDLPILLLPPHLLPVPHLFWSFRRCLLFNQF